MKVNNYPVKVPSAGDRLFGSDSNGDQKQFDMSAVSSDVFQYEIGQYVEDEGGVIFHRYLDGDTQKYLVVSIDKYPEQDWSNIKDKLIGSTAQSTWNGLSNSNAIVGQLEFIDGAAKTCLDLVSLGKNDWYLPSIDEASLIIQNRFNVNKTLENVVGSSILFHDFWTSTESNATSAYYFKNFQTSLSPIEKDASIFVRPVRKFSI